MKKTSILLLCSTIAAMTASAGERETFDFGWQFKYYGPGNPPDASSAAQADSSEAANTPANAIDGNMDSRWCASDAKSNHWIEVKLGKTVKLSSIKIDWENDKTQEAKLTVTSSKNGSKTRTIKVEGASSEVKINAACSKIKIQVTKSQAGSWASIREITFLDENGQVIKPELPKNATPTEAQATYKAKGYKDVQLPHDWAIESPFLKDEPNETGKLPWNGYGWYRKSFQVDADFSAEKDRYFLDFDGVMANPKIYVNGQLAGEWAYGYAPFRVDITPYLKAGAKNVIAVQASNKLLSTRWYPGAGIYRHVWLEKTTPVHIDQWGVQVQTPSITDESATVSITTTVNNTSNAAADITVEQSIAGTAAEPKTITLAAKSTAAVTQEITLANPKRWDMATPNLYAVETSIKQGETQLDTASTNFGVRTIEWKADGFYLNGTRVPLNGVCEHHDLGALGSAFYSRGMERKIEILKGMGCNSIRTAHNPPAKELLELCDKHGMLVIDELFDIWKSQKYDKTNGYHVNWEKWWKRDLSNFVRRDRNHPSIIAWSGGNEIDEIYMAGGKEISQGLKDEFAKYDPTRPYTVGVNHKQGAWNGFGDISDTFGYNYKPFKYKKYAEQKPGKSFYASETASCVGTRDTYFFPLRWDIGGGFRNFQVSAFGLYAPGWAYCPDVEFKCQDESGMVAGEYVWTGFDYIGEPTPYNQDASNIGNFHGATEEEKAAAMKQLKEMGNKAPSRSSYFGIVDLAGFPKDTYYLYMSKWAPEKPQAHILPHWNWKGREGEVTPVMVFSSGDEAELFLNGESQGVRKRTKAQDAPAGETFTQQGVTVGKNEYRFTWEEVKYKAGELKVVVKKDGQPWAEATRATTGKAASVEAKVDRTSIVGDARDLAHIELALTDAKGNVVPTDSRKVKFSISGPALLIGFCNGNPVDQSCMQDMEQSFFNGRILAIVRGNRGASGTAVVRIEAEGLPAQEVVIDIQAATPEQLKK